MSNGFPYYNGLIMPPQAESNEGQKTNSAKHTIREWIQTIVIALLVALPIRFFIAEPFIVNGASMDPTFSTGQFLIVDRVTYRFEKPERGDVVIFEYPNNPSVYYIKRVIGLPSETVDIKDGRVFVGTSTASTMSERCAATPLQLTEKYVRADHASHESLCASLGPSEYFVLGDNRAESSDSRVWGPLDRHFIIGKPVVRLLPLGAISILPGKSNEYVRN